LLEKLDVMIENDYIEKTLINVMIDTAQPERLNESLASR